MLLKLKIIINKLLFLIILFVVIFNVNYLLAATSPNYKLQQEENGSTEFEANSPNYKFKAVIGEPGIGKSTSPNYIFEHGRWWYEETGSALTATIKWAVPEYRVGADETNDDTTFYIRVLSSDDNDDTVIFTSNLATTNVDGTYNTPINLTGVAAGTYDVIIKGHQHISRKLNDINLNLGNNVLNFTQPDNSSSKGVLKLVAGDINGTGDSPDTLGDNVINSVDITVLLANFNDDDPTGNLERANINQDTIVNSVDLSIILANFNEEGET